MKCKNCLERFKVTKKPTAFVLDCYITGLSVIRLLGRKGIPVIGLDSKKNRAGFHSRYCSAIKCPDPRQNENEFIEFLIHIGEKLDKKGVLIPTTDIYLLAVLKYRKKLEEFYHFTMAEKESSEILINKKMFYKKLEELKIDHQKVFFPKDLKDLEIICEKISFPFLLKPIYSGLFRSDFKTKLFVVQTKKQLTDFYNKCLAKNHEMIIQEIIPGNATDMYGFNAYYDKNSKPHGTFNYRRIREWPHPFGNGCYIEKSNKPEFEKIITPLIQNIKYYGIVDVEIKKDSRDNKWKLIEINARPWMQISLPYRYGINYPFMAYNYAVNNEIKDTGHRKEDVKWILVIEDLKSSISSMFKKELYLADWVKSLKGKKEFAYFNWDDPIPSFILNFSSKKSKI
jgi:predicted ATP-grasp superfamily ATP-dependent carboligase